MKRECPSPFAALLVSPFVVIALRQDRLLAAPDFFSVVPARWCWPPSAGCSRGAGGWLLTRYTSCCLHVVRLHPVLELLRLWQLAACWLYPGAVIADVGLSARRAARSPTCGGCQRYPRQRTPCLPVGGGNHRHAGVGFSTASGDKSASHRCSRRAATCLPLQKDQLTPPGVSLPAPSGRR